MGAQENQQIRNTTIFLHMDEFVDPVEILGVSEGGHAHHLILTFIDLKA
jgi:hypothetical protein